MYKVGQQVVCINDKKQNNCTLKAPSENVIKGKIYTIKGFDSVGGIKFIELKCGRYLDNEESGFQPSRFAPLEEYQNHKKGVEQLIKELELQVN